MGEGKKKEKTIKSVSGEVPWVTSSSLKVVLLLQSEKCFSHR
jgi:hypothetical protein